MLLPPRYSRHLRRFPSSTPDNQQAPVSNLHQAFSRPPPWRTFNLNPRYFLAIFPLMVPSAIRAIISARAAGAMGQSHFAQQLGQQGLQSP